jgi:hypothetical protein
MNGRGGRMGMQTRKLGGSELEITLVGYGAWAIGGAGWAFAWGGQDDRESVGAMRAGELRLTGDEVREIEEEAPA